MCAYFLLGIFMIFTKSITNEVLEYANNLLKDLGFICLTPEEINLLNRLCFTDYYDNLSTQCKGLFIVINTMRMRNVPCVTQATLDYLQSLSDCNQCGFSVEEMFNNNRNNKLFLSGSIARGRFYCND